MRLVAPLIRTHTHTHMHTHTFTPSLLTLKCQRSGHHSNRRLKLIIKTSLRTKDMSDIYSGVSSVLHAMLQSRVYHMHFHRGNYKKKSFLMKNQMLYGMNLGIVICIKVGGRRFSISNKLFFLNLLRKKVVNIFSQKDANFFVAFFSNTSISSLSFVVL